MMRVTIRQCEQPADTYHVFVGNWAFPHFDFGFHSGKTARKIKRLFDSGDMIAAIKESRKD